LLIVEKINILNLRFIRKTGIIMIVKTLRTTALAAAILSASTVASASALGMKQFHAGVDVMGTTLNWKENGKNFFPKNPMAFGAFVGGSYYACNNFGLGLELGAEYMQKTKDVTLTLGRTTTTGIAITGTDSLTFKNKLKAFTPYLGLTGEYRVHPQFKLIGMIGAGAMFARMDQTYSNGIINNVAEAPNATTKFKKTAFVPMARLGAQFNLHENVGIRATVGYRYTNNLSKNATTPTGSTAVLKAKSSELVYGAGIVVSF
jgi:hypothetical protein